MQAQAPEGDAGLSAHLQSEHHAVLLGNLNNLQVQLGALSTAQHDIGHECLLKAGALATQVGELKQLLECAHTAAADTTTSSAVLAEVKYVQTQMSSWDSHMRSTQHTVDSKLAALLAKVTSVETVHCDVNTSLLAEVRGMHRQLEQLLATTDKQQVPVKP